MMRGDGRAYRRGIWNILENETSVMVSGRPKRTDHFAGNPEFTAVRPFASEKG